MESAYELDTSPKPAIWKTGKATRGINAVAASGSAPVIHRAPMRTMMAAVIRIASRSKGPTLSASSCKLASSALSASSAALSGKMK